MEFPSRLIVGELPGVQINTIDHAPIHNTSATSSAVLAANTAVFVPVRVTAPVTITKLGFQLGAASGTIDVGVYGQDGVRLVSTGASAGAVGINIRDVTNTPMGPGLFYLAVLSSDATATHFGASYGAVGRMIAAGCFTQAVGAATLPAVATFAAPSLFHYPYLWATVQERIA